MTEKKNPIPKNFQKDNNLITGSKGSKKKTMQVITPIEGGAIGTGTKKIEKPIDKKIVEKKEIEKVAIHSTKNVYLPGVGKVLKGYNIVKREAADKWLARDHIREATPEEIAREYGL